MNGKTVWVSAVGPSLQTFLDWKRLAGYQFLPQEWRWHQFDDFCAGQAVSLADLTRPVLDAFCAGTGYESVSTGENRRRLLRQWADYLEQSGQGMIARPTPNPTPTRRSRYQPNIYTEQELRALFAAIDAWPSYPNTNRTLVDPVLFRMLYGCGIRLGEALRLRRDDVDRETGVLRIRQGKNRKDRLVPMAAALTDRCRSFDRRVHAASEGTASFYPGQHGNVYDQSTIYRRFRDYLWTARISHSGAGPRIHDLRYPNLNKIPTFCTKRCDHSNLSKKRFGFFLWSYAGLIPKGGQPKGAVSGMCLWMSVVSLDLGWHQMKESLRENIPTFSRQDRPS